MSDIFISYASEDPSQAEVLAQMLAGQGWSVFWDRTISAGRKWRETIVSELDEARCVIVLWTKASIVSDWVQEEADEARRRGIIVPVLMERNVQAPIGFRSIQAARLWDWDGTDSTPAFRRLIADITTLIGPSPKKAGKKRRLVEAEAAHRSPPPRQAASRSTQKGKAKENRKRGDGEATRDTAPDDAETMYSLGRRSAEAKDYLAAREWYAKAAAKGHVEAMYFLGRSCWREQDYGEARKWFEKAAAMGHADAMFSLGCLYEDIYNVSRDDFMACRWFEMAAAKGHVRAMFQLGTIYYQGRDNVPRDYIKARAWWEKAAAKGDMAAKSLIEQYLAGIPSQT